MKCASVFKCFLTDFKFTNYLFVAVMCPAVPDIFHAKAVLISEETSFNSTVVYTCIHGYIADSGQSSFTATCTSNGTWTFHDAQGTSCIGKYVLVRYTILCFNRSGS